MLSDFGCCSLAQMSFVHRYLPYFKQQLITRPLSALLSFQFLFTESSGGDQLLASPPSPVYSKPLCCTFLFSSLLIIFLWGRSQSVQEAMLVYPRGGCGNRTCRLFVHLLVYISQACLEFASGGAGALLFSQCNMVQRSFVPTGGSGCQSFDSSW
jgi:hypothetical protein